MWSENILCMISILLRFFFFLFNCCRVEWRFSSSLAPLNTRGESEAGRQLPHFLPPSSASCCWVQVGTPPVTILCQNYRAGITVRCRFLPGEEGKFVLCPWGHHSVGASGSMCLEDTVLTGSGEVMERGWGGAVLTLVLIWSKAILPKRFSLVSSPF